MIMSERPLFIDISSHQTYLDLNKSVAGEVLGVIMRATVGLNKDVDFVAFDNYYDWNKLYRGSYHALWPMYSVFTQVDRWMEVDPDGYIHMLDAELHNDLPPKEVAEAIVIESDSILERTGKRPWMYGAYYFLMDYLIPFASEEWLNEHWWVLAAYGDGDDDEDDGYSMMLPDKIDIDRIALQQTTAKAELYPGSGNVDRDRFLLGGEEELKDFMDEWLGIEEPVEPTDCCEDLELTVVDNHNRINTNTSEIEALKKDIATDRLNFDALQTLTNTNSLGIAELARRFETLQQGQIELVENGLGYENKIKEIEAEAIFWDLNIDNHNKLVDKLNELDKKTVKQTNLLLDSDKQLHDKIEETGDYFEDKVRNLYKEIDDHSHVEPVGGTFGQRIRWLFTGKTSRRS